MSQQLEKMIRKLQLADVVQALREELNIAKYRASGHDVRFNVNNIEVEFQTAVELDTSVEGGNKIKFWVLDIDAKASGKYTQSTTHKIKLTLEPVSTTYITDVKNEESVLEKKVRISGSVKK